MLRRSFFKLLAGIPFLPLSVKQWGEQKISWTGYERIELFKDTDDWYYKVISRKSESISGRAMRLPFQIKG